MMATSVWVCLSVLLLACVVAGEASTINGATSAADAIVLALGSTTTVRSTNTGPVYFRVTNAPADGRLAVDVVNKELYYPKLPSVVIKASEGMSIGSSPFVEHAWSAEQAILGVCTWLWLVLCSCDARRMACRNVTHFCSFLWFGCCCGFVCSGPCSVV